MWTKYVLELPGSVLKRKRPFFGLLLQLLTWNAVVTAGALAAILNHESEA